MPHERNSGHEAKRNTYWTQAQEILARQHIHTKDCYKIVLGMTGFLLHNFMEFQRHLTSCIDPHCEASYGISAKTVNILSAMCRDAKYFIGTPEDNRCETKLYSLSAAVQCCYRLDKETYRQCKHWQTWIDGECLEDLYFAHDIPLLNSTSEKLQRQTS